MSETVEHTTRKKVILVDDVEFNLRMWKRKLQDIYEVYPANSAARMFMILNNVKPDIILLDVNMPECDGFQTLKLLKADSRYASIPVIFLTSRSDESSVISGICLGAADYVVKPFSLHYLNERIAKVLMRPECDLLEKNVSAPDVTNKPSVLAIDDIPFILRTVYHALSKRYQVYLLSKPEKIESFLARLHSPPELILLDFNMPVIDGHELFLKIRELPDHKETPIIFLTSESNKDVVTAALTLGACDYILKPFTQSVLMNKVSKHIYKGKD